MAGGRRLALISVLAIGALGWGALPGPGLRGTAELADVRGSVDCRPDPSATTTEYLVGLACPPAGFVRALGYQPVLVDTSGGWRYTRPASFGGQCNGPIGDAGPFWDFSAVCQAHDYGYDLVRFGIGDRGEADHLLYLDMIVSCSDRGAVAEIGCRAIAEWARAVLHAGDALGFDPEVLPRGSAATEQA